MMFGKNGYEDILDNARDFLDSHGWSDAERYAMRQMVDQQRAEIRDAGLTPEQQVVVVMSSVALTAMEFPPIIAAQAKLLMSGHLDEGRNLPLMVAGAVMLDVLGKGPQ